VVAPPGRLSTTSPPSAHGDTVDGLPMLRATVGRALSRRTLFRESIEGELWLSGAPRIAQRGQSPRGVAAINPIMHQEASEEGVHLCAPGGRETGKCSSRG
jgi:hypothetical protein